MLRFAIFLDCFLNFLYRTHSHSFPFVVWVYERRRFSRFEIEDMSLNHTSVTLDLNLPALLALQGSLIPVLGQNSRISSPGLP